MRVIVKDVGYIGRRSPGDWLSNQAEQRTLRLKIISDEAFNILPHTLTNNQTCKNTCVLHAVRKRSIKYAVIRRANPRILVVRYAADIG